jgi:magnesium transporter
MPLNLSQKISFLLDAMLGVVSLEQNNIIKIFSVAAVVFMPPTLIASIYGMNSSTCRNSISISAIRSPSP